MIDKDKRINRGSGKVQKTVANSIKRKIETEIRNERDRMQDALEMGDPESELK